MDALPFIPIPFGVVAILVLMLPGCTAIDEAYSHTMAVEWANARIVCREMIERGETPVWPCPP